MHIIHKRQCSRIYTEVGYTITIYGIYEKTERGKLVVIRAVGFCPVKISVASRPRVSDLTLTHLYDVDHPLIYLSQCADLHTQTHNAHGIVNQQVRVLVRQKRQSKVNRR